MPSHISRPASICLYITPQIIAAVQIRTDAARVSVTAHGAVKTPSGVFDGPAIHDRSRLAAGIRSLWKQMSWTERQVSVILPSAAYSMRAMRFPDLPERERRSVARGELEQTGALPYGAGRFDYLWVRAGAQADAYAYYTSDALVEGLEEALRLAGLRLVALEPESVARARAFLAGRGEHELVAVFCPAEKHSDLFIHDGREVRQIRRIPTGWADLEAGTAGPHAPVPVEPAPGSRGDHTDLVLLGNEADDYAGSVSTSNIDGELAYVVPSVKATTGAEGETPASSSFTSSSGDAEELPFIVSEVARSLAFYNRESPVDARPRRLVIVAPAAPARHYLELLAPSLHLPTSVEDPLPESTLPAANAPFELLPMVHQASVAAAGGAAAAMGLTAGLPLVNIAWEPAGSRGAQPKAITVAGIAGSALWLAAALGVTAVLYLVGAGQQRDSEQLGRRIKALRAERAPLVRQEALGRAAVGQQTKNGVPAGSVLGRVAAATNDKIQLSRLDVQPAGKLTIEGRAGDTQGLQQFTRELGQGQSIRNPVIESLKQETGGLVSFRVTASYPYTPPATAAGK